MPLQLDGIEHLTLIVCSRSRLQIDANNQDRERRRVFVRV